MSDPEVKETAAPEAAPVLGLDAFDTTAAADEGAVMEVRSPATGEVMYWPDGRPWTITYFGADSEKVAKAAFQMNDRRSQAMSRTRQPTPAATLLKDNIELLVAATKEWDIPLGDGTPAKNNPKEYRAAYTKYKWLFEQGDQFTGNRGNFPLKGSKTP
jgi:hypothetical protein